MRIARYFNALAVLALVGSAIYAYSIKYETILYSERIKKTKNANAALRDQIGILRAEWAHVTRPENIQALAEKHLDLQQLDLKQIGSIAELPDRPPKIDSIGRKLEILGLAEPTTTPSDRSPTGSTTPAAPSATRRPKP
jgi:hypothetical protein